MKQEIKNSVEQVKPWGKRTPWWILLIEGILAIGLGIYALAMPLQAQGLVLILSLIHISEPTRPY